MKHLVSKNDSTISAVTTVCISLKVKLLCNLYLVTNSFLCSYCPFLKTKRKNQVFSKLFSVHSESRSTSKPCLIQLTFCKRTFVCMLFVLCIVPWSYLRDLFFIFIFIMIKHIISWINICLLFCLPFRICFIFGWQRGLRIWIIIS